MDVPDFLKPESKLAPSGTDPLAMPTHRARGPNKLLIALMAIGMIAACAVGSWGMVRNVTGAGAAPATGSPTPSPTLPAPALRVEEPNATPGPSATLITASGLMTQLAEELNLQPSATASSDPCAGMPGHFLTELACQELGKTATLQAAQPGEIVNISGVDSRVTLVYVYPTVQPTPWIVTATQTFTPVVIIQTVEVQRIITATPGPTQTPWFYITQPPVVTVVSYQTVVVYYTQEVTREVTVVLTATPSETLTATATETPTP